MKFDKNDLLLYAVTDRRWLNGETLYEQVEKAIHGGVTLVQLREKDLNKEEFVHEAREIKKLCAREHIPFVINDDVDVALSADADGVHVGQSDRCADEVRATIGKDKLLGVSVQSVEQALLAQRCGADYLGVGAVFATGSKSDAEDVSFDTLKNICEAVDIPVVAIGGIGEENVLRLSGSGVCGIAVISALFAQRDIRAAAARLKALSAQMVKA